MEWTLYRELVDGEQLWQSWRMSVDLGTMYRESLTVIDANTHLVKSYAESQIFVPQDAPELTWTIEKITQTGEKNEKLYSAPIEGGTAYLTKVAWIDSVTHIVKIGWIDVVQFSSEEINDTLYLLASPTAGGDVVESLTVPGLRSTDQVLWVATKTAGTGPTPAVSATAGPTANTLPAAFSNDPGAGMIAIVAVVRTVP